MASPRRRTLLPLVAVVVIALAWPLHVAANLDSSPRLRIIPRQFLGDVAPGQGDSTGDSSGVSSNLTDSGITSTPVPQSASSPSASASSALPSPTIPSLTLTTSSSSDTLAIISTSSTVSSSALAPSSSASLPSSLSSSRSDRNGRSSSTDSSTSSVTTPAYSPSSFLSIPLPTASNTSGQKDKGVGLGKGTLITIAVIASIVGAIAAVWTVVRKWKLSPSRRFEKKLEDIDTDFYQPRPPSFVEKPQYYNLGHHREPSLGSGTNFAGYGAGAGNITEPPQAHGHHPGNVAAWASQSALGRSDSGGSSGRNVVGAVNKGGYDTVPLYPHEPYPPQAYSQVPLHPGSCKPHDAGFGPTSMGGYRTGSPAVPLRGPSPGYAQLPPTRTMSPGYAKTSFDNGLHRQNTGASAHSDGFSNPGNHLPYPGADGGIKRTGAPGALFQANVATASYAGGQPPSALHY